MEPEGGAEASIRIETTRIVTQPALVQPDLEARRALQQEPAATPVMFQTWSDLLFLHWERDPAEIQALLPPGLFVDTWGGKAYVGLIPFRMTGVRASFLPEIPGANDFLEVNVRTYVHDRDGQPGVWFFSLDLNHGLGVMFAKVFYALRYHNADIEAPERPEFIEYRCRRHSAAETSVIRCSKEARTVSAPPGSLPFFLAERYLLFAYSERAQKLCTARVHHAPWQLFQARVGECDEVMLRLNNLAPSLRPPDHHWAAAPVRVKIYALHGA